MFSTNMTTRSNHNLFIPYDTGSPHDSLMTHIAGLGRIARLDFERCAVAGEVIYAIEGDSAPVSQQADEARIGTLAYAIRKLGNAVDAAEFIRCLNAICEDGDARCRQTVASHYFNEIGERGASDVLKEMGLFAMQLASLNSVTEVIETETPYSNFESESPFVSADESDPENIRFFFEQEVGAIKRMIGGRRKSARAVHDECAEWLNDLEENGASLEELDDAFAHAEAIEQYDEGGAIITMSSHERTVACGRVDPEFTSEDLPERAQHLASQLRRDYANGVGLEEIWDDISAEIEIIFPVSGKTETCARFYSHANRELQRFTRQALEAILDECEQDFHLTALRNNRTYRQFHKAIRGTKDTRIVSETMKQAYEARQSGLLPLKHFVALKAASTLQRERLQSARLSGTAFKLINEINAASEARLRYLSWAFYGANQPNHPIHKLTAQDASRVWSALKARKQEPATLRRAA
ncbi:MAG: hypothetical protein AB7U82_25900 [Blastocatellales bacterium]